MKIHFNLLFLLFGLFYFTDLIRAQTQNQTGFISLDCGLQPNDSNYTDANTNISYISDANFVETGVISSIKLQNRSNIKRQARFLRSFPEGIRNCYRFNLTRDQRYLIKTYFLYGNYDGLNKLPSFDVYLGPNRWSSVVLERVNKETRLDIIHVLTSDRLEICLVKTGDTVPFISAIELRPLPSDTYVTKGGSLLAYNAWYFSSNDSRLIRFDEDVHDRTWSPTFNDLWTGLSTPDEINRNNSYQPPQHAMATAATPTNSTEPLRLVIEPNDASSQLYVYMHIAEIENLQPNELREFNISYNGNHWFGPWIPNQLALITIYTEEALGSSNGTYEFLFEKTEKSTHPPLLNAVEIYTVIEFLQTETDQNDADAVKHIKDMYGVNKASWQGDPCFPMAYKWEGLNCTNTTFEPPRITSLNLSSSHLTGKIAPYIQNLSQLVTLDLSNNNLTGEVPEFLAEINSLKLLILSRNQLNGSIPAKLLERRNQNSLTLIIEGNPNLCDQTTPCHIQQNSFKRNKTTKKLIVPVVTSIAAFLVIVSALVIFYVIIRRKKDVVEAEQPMTGSRSVVSSEATSSETKGRKFSYSEVLRMTNNFQQVLGKGGYGKVYHGNLGAMEVAVKMLSHSSAQGYKDFKIEVEVLSRVHHKNLVNLVGYCDEGDNMSLIYEFMANGDLKTFLSGKGGSDILSWDGRVKIALEAAQGLEYLHIGCKPAIVHRDVKTTNILLDEHCQAKLGDFGLSRSFSVEDATHVSTVVAGTPGYLDPEYYTTNWLTEKSDVYSFGVALLEIITNRAVIDKRREKPHITEWVGMMLTKGDIKSIIDPELQGSYDPNYVWKVVEVAMACVNPSSSRRPTMTYVVTELTECLAKKDETEEIEPQGLNQVSVSFGRNSSPGGR